MSIKTIAGTARSMGITVE
ncbi:hypothetical protein [Amycolatopsis acidiphila]